MNVYDFLVIVVFPIIAMVVLPVFVVVVVFVWKRLPKPARGLFWAKRRGQIPIMVTHDSGRTELQFITERLGGGVVITNTGKWKLLPKYVSSNIYRQLGLEDVVEEENDEDDNTDDDGNPIPKVQHPPPAEKTTDEQPQLQYVPDYSDWVNKRSNLIGMDMPIYFGYSGVLCLLSPFALAAYEKGELVIPTERGDFFKGDPDKKGSSYKPLMLLETRKIREIINDSFDETQMAAIATESEQIGRLGRGMGKYMNIILIVAVIGLIIAAIFFLPSILPK